MKQKLILLAATMMFVFSMSINFNANQAASSSITAVAGSSCDFCIYKKNCFLKSGCKWHESNNNCQDTFINC